MSTTPKQGTTIDLQAFDEEHEDDGICHIFCVGCGAKPDGRLIAYCGKDVTNDKFLGVYTSPNPEDCLVCVDLYNTHNCPR